jgi:hypothetical protein
MSAGTPLPNPAGDAAKLGNSAESRTIEGVSVKCRLPQLCVRVITRNGAPVNGAKLILDSDPQRTSGKSGSVDFGRRERGRHSLSVAVHFAGTPYRDDQDIDLQNDREVVVRLNLDIVHLFLDAARDGNLTRDGIGEWSSKRGAIVLCNCNADGGLIVDGVVQPDSADDQINGAADLEGIAPVDVRWEGSSPPQLQATLSFANRGDRERLRIFRQRTPGARAVLGGPEGADSWLVDLSEPVCGLGMEAIRFDRCDASGYPEKNIELVLSVADNNGVSYTERGVVRVAPWIMQHQLAAPIHVFGAPWERDNVMFLPSGGVRNLNNDRFLTALGAIASAVTAQPLDRRSLCHGNDRWAQDCAEFGFTVSPKKTFPVILRAPRGAETLASCVPKLRTGECGVVDLGGSSAKDLDKFGNLEVTPPVPGWPLGRIYYGTRDTETLDRNVLSFLYGQKVQKPLPIDTSFLDVGHVDEILAFVGTADNWKLCIPDPELSYFLIELAARVGLGSCFLRDRYRYTGNDNQREVIPFSTVGLFLGRKEALAAEAEENARGRFGQKIGMENSTYNHGRDRAVDQLKRAWEAEGPREIPEGSSINLRDIEEELNRLPLSPIEREWFQQRLQQTDAASLVRQKTVTAEAVVSIHALKSKCDKAKQELESGRAAFLEEEAENYTSRKQGEAQTIRHLNNKATASLEQTKKMLKTEISLADDQIIPVPVVYFHGAKKSSIALTGNMTNMLVLGRDCVMCQPFGPEVHPSMLKNYLLSDNANAPRDRDFCARFLGLTPESLDGERDGPIDLFQRWVEHQLRAAGLIPHFIDNWDSYHAMGGEVHCGTNTLRRYELQAKWWMLDTKPERMPPLTAAAPPQQAVMGEGMPSHLQRKPAAAAAAVGPGQAATGQPLQRQPVKSALVSPARPQAPAPAVNPAALAAVVGPGQPIRPQQMKSAPANPTAPTAPTRAVNPAAATAAVGPSQPMRPQPTRSVPANPTPPQTPAHAVNPAKSTVPEPSTKPPAEDPPSHDSDG